MASIVFTIPAKYGKRRGPRPGVKSGYKQRDDVLFRMGFASYGDYLKSALWKAIRTAKLATDPKCELCDSKAQQVHHIAYTFGVMKGHAPHSLVSVCNGCHRNIEVKEDGSKRSFEASRKRTRLLLSRRQAWEKHTRKGNTP